MNLDDVTEVWRSKDLSQLFGVDEMLLHQVLQQERAKLEKRLRRIRWFMYVVNILLFLMAVLFLAIMIDPRDDDVLIVWDYVVAAIGVACTGILAGALYVARRSRQKREQGFGDSLRDHLRRRIAELDDETIRERRLAMVMVATALIGGWAISIAAHRINDVPWGEFRWRPRLPTLLIVASTYLLLFRWIPRARLRNLTRKPQLEALLKELDDQ